MQRYTAKLLFQYRADFGDGHFNTMRRCEVRLVVFLAKTANSALRKAKLYAKRREYEGKAEAGNLVRFEFVGVAELLALDPACEPDEVWYDIVTMKLPSERRDALIPLESNLNAIYWESQDNK